MFGFTIDWQIVLLWILSVGVTTIILSVLGNYATRFSDHQLVKYFSWWKRNQDEEDELLTTLANQLGDTHKRTEYELKRFISFALVLITLSVTFIELGQLVLTFSILDGQQRTIILAAIFVMVLTISGIAIRTHRIYVKVGEKYMKLLEQKYDTLLQQEDLLTKELDKANHTIQILEQILEQRDLKPNPPN